MTAGNESRVRDLTWVVALAAALWGTDALLRLPLAQQVAAPTIVFAEHAVLVLVLVPFLPRAIRGFRRLGAGGRLAVVGIGAGASAVATTLFTLSFRYGDPVTPAVIQKFQPIIAILGAALLLHERLRPSFAWFAIPALAGAWLLAFPDPRASARISWPSPCSPSERPLCGLPAPCSAGWWHRSSPRWN